MPTPSNPIVPTVYSTDAINRLIELGGSVASIQERTGGDPFLVIPNGCKIEPIAHLAPPKRIKQVATLTDADSFIGYVNRFKLPQTQIFASVSDTAASLCAVFDYHRAEPAGGPEYAVHRAQFTLANTLEWKVWMAADRKRMPQLDFAIWLEENAGLLQLPSGVELLELVSSLHGHIEARFNQTYRLKDGATKLAYDEDVVVRGSTTATSKPGELELPSHIEALIAPFEGSEAVAITARLKVRCDNRKLVLWFETVNPHQIVRECVRDTLSGIAEATEITPLMGSI